MKVLKINMRKIGIKYHLEEEIISLFLKNKPTKSTKREITEPTKRTILKSPALIKMLYSIIKPKIVDSIDELFATKLSL